jgi:molybdopterin-guanine dinucleotide biosynthesis protein A
MNCIILAGGKNSRMKKNKAFLKINNSTIIESLLNKFHKNFSNIILVTNEPWLYQHLDVTITSDIIPSKGPLSGIHAGLEISEETLNFVVACDMPNLKWEFAYYLLNFKEDYDVIVPHLKGNFEPLCAIYSKNCSKRLKYCLENNIYKITEFYGLVKTRPVSASELSAYGNIANILLNVNTPREYENFTKSLNVKNL